MKMNHEEYVKLKRVRAVEVASGMIDGTIDYLEGVIELSSLRHEVDLPSDDRGFLTFTGVASEIDHLPIGVQRQHWSEKALERHEPDIQRAIKWA